jgi:tyrosinase
LYPLDSVDKLEAATMPKVQQWVKRKSDTTCTMENAAVRRDWSDLSVPEREVLKAVLCLQSKPPQVPKATAPGAKSRFDDFVAFQYSTHTCVSSSGVDRMRPEHKP